MIRKRQRQGLRSRKKRSLTCINEYFSGKYNAVFGIFLQRPMSYSSILIIKW